MWPRSSFSYSAYSGNAESTVRHLNDNRTHSERVSNSPQVSQILSRIAGNKPSFPANYAKVLPIIYYIKNLN